MPLSADLLTPIAGDNPSGKNLKWDPVYDQIQEARRKEDPVNRGDWQRALKEADYRQVLKLGQAALGRSKDLQIAAWLAEALVYQEGLNGLRQGMDLLRGLLENFFDTVYPLPDDGDMEIRTAPLGWVGAYRDMDVAVRSIPLTKSKYSWFIYHDSRTVGYEADIGESDAKKQARNDAIEEGKLTAEEFDADVEATSIDQLQKAVDEAAAALESLTSLDEFSAQKFGSDAPSFRSLRLAIEDVHHVARMLLATKPQPEAAEPEPEPEEEPVETESVEPVPIAAAPQPAAAAVAVPARARAAAVTAEPADREDALRRIAAHAAYLRREDPCSPVPYLVLRGLRWGELRANGEVDPELLAAPQTEVRQQVRRFMQDGDWEKVLEAAETAMGEPCGRGWLDLQRYVVRACRELGGSYDAIASSVQSELRALLADFPQLPSMTLLDDTATANGETQAWLTELLPPPPAPQQEVEDEPPQPSPRFESDDDEDEPEELRPPDAYDLATEQARRGDVEEAIRILAEQVANERSGRGRFLRKLQLAQICVHSQRHAIAHPILQELAEEIELRKLDSWELPESIAQAFSLLLQSMQSLDLDKEERRRIYSRVCRLDPVQAARLVD